ncbi:MAG: DNA mismatch repair protein MutS [Thermonemataceae bacterium]
MKSTKETPLMKQYNMIKKKYPGALLLFRVGDFYETFGQDAIKASKILGIVLTKRANGAASETELAGFPHHALDTYLPKLVKAGERVAICDQLEDPKQAKGIVRRGVTELVTPGISFNDNVLDVKKNNYLCAICRHKEAFGIAFLDASTGEFLTTQGTFEYIEKLLQSFSPSEILYPKPLKNEFIQLFGEDYHHFFLEDWVFHYDFAFEKLVEHFKVKSLKGFGIAQMREGITAAGAILYYLKETEHHEIGHIAHLARLEEDKYVWLDRFTIRNLELIYPQQESGVPLIQILDQTNTPMGGRLLRKWIVLPLKEVVKIEERLQWVETLVAQAETREKLVTSLQPIGDLERLISKVATKRINPKEIVALKRAIEQLPVLIETLQTLTTIVPPQVRVTVEKLLTHLDACTPLWELIGKTLKEDPPVITTQGKMIQSGIDPALDELHALAASSKDYLEKLLQREIKNTGIQSLKIQYNKVFGYYIEVSNANKDKVPADWVRKQTLTNAERYVTEELKEYEEKILTAEEKINVIEQRIYQETVQAACAFIAPIQQNARLIATLDCLLSFALVAITHKYIKPQIAEDNQIDIKAGRHPVIEQQLSFDEPYIPNDVFLDDQTQQIIVITGPNMAGKSALLRQVALITLMAQMGSFVPAQQAHISLVDKVFTRVGASDNLAKGESTFMVEMTETASIMNNLSSRSLILMDEIGRGTSTYDGISIAWSIVEYLHEHPTCKAKTLFATHYHELNQLASQLPRVKNYNIAVKEKEGKVIFLRKLEAGGSEHSFGIHVAQMAGMPPTIVHRANEVLITLEKEKLQEKNKRQLQSIPSEESQLQLQIFDYTDKAFQKVKDMLDEIDLNTTTPIEALMKLSELKKELNNTH